jgi:hypothetical protein
MFKNSLEAPVDNEKLLVSSRRRYSPANSSFLNSANNFKRLEIVLPSNDALPNKKAKEQQKIIKKQQSRYSFLILIVGKLIGLLRKTRSSLGYRKLGNMNLTQYEFINDLAYYKSHFNRLKMENYQRAKLTRMASRIRVILDKIIYIYL